MKGIQCIHFFLICRVKRIYVECTLTEDFIYCVILICEYVRRDQSFQFLFDLITSGPKLTFQNTLF